MGLAWELSSYPSLGFEWSHAAGSNSRYRCGKCRDQRRPRVRQGNPKQRQLSWRLPQRSVSRGNFSKIDFDETMMMGVKVLALARETSKTEVREVVTLPRNKSVGHVWNWNERSYEPISNQSKQGSPEPQLA